jgi:Ser/Thr protein kinase RdoA (MazF antagonist)
VLDALDAVGWRGDGRLTALNSYENRVFQVMLEDGEPVVAKFYRPRRWTDEQLAEEHAFSLEAAAFGVPVVAPLAFPRQPPGPLVRPCPAAPETLAVLASDGAEWRFAVWPRRAGRPANLEDAAVLEHLGLTLGRLHQVGERAAFRHRPALWPLPMAQEAVQALAQLDVLPLDQHAAWQAATQEALSAIARDTQGPRPAALRLHGDVHPGNLLWRQDQPNLVDLDDAGQGPAVQDLWMLLSGDADEASLQLQALLRGYQRVRAFDHDALRWIGALRLARMLRHNAWVARRWGDPAFPAAYPDFGSSGYWAQQAVQLREQIRQNADETPWR